GQVAMLQYGYWFSAMAESDITKGKTVFLPAPTWSGVRRDPTMTATGWVVSAQTKDPDAAWAVFEQYMGGKPALDRAKSGWGVPGLKSLYKEMPPQPALHQQGRRGLTAATPRPPLPQPGPDPLRHPPHHSVPISCRSPVTRQ